MNDRLIAIGDIHGCIDELDLLLRAIAPGPRDRFVLLGDLVDRGPDTPAVVRRARELLRAHPGSVVVRGNHEAKVRRILARPDREGARSWMGEMRENELDWLASTPLYARDRSRNLVFVHGGFFPRYFEHHGALPEDPAELDAAGRKQRERAERFAFVRHVDAHGDMIRLGGESAETRNWAEVYDGREGFACFGHQPFMDAPQWFEHALALDGACAFGGALLAAVWEGAGLKRPEIVRRAAKRAYAELRRESEED